jgi:hypothetical protein
VRRFVLREVGRVFDQNEPVAHRKALMYGRSCRPQSAT